MKLELYLLKTKSKRSFMNFLLPVFISSLILMVNSLLMNTSDSTKKTVNNPRSIFIETTDTVGPDSTSMNLKDSFSWTDTITESPLKKIVIKYTKQIDMPIVRDTIQIIDLGMEVLDTVLKEQSRDVRKKSAYNVAVVLPFMTNIFSGNDIPAQSARAVEFYEGVEIALDSLRNEGVNLKISVFDSKKDSASINEVIDKMKGVEWDLIIGPAHTEVLKELAIFAKDKQVPLVSPFNNNPEICEDNHFFIQVNPSYEIIANHIVSIMLHAKATNPAFRKSKYLILGTSDDSLKMEQIQKAYALHKNSETEILPKLISNEAINVGSIMKYFDRSALNIVVIANDRNEQFIYSSLREISTMYDKVEKSKSYQILVIGEPGWKYLERINFEYYDNLRLHIADNFFVDKEEPKNKIFEEEFRKRYGIAPREFAYTGFDVMLYFGRLLKKYGTAFPDNFEKENRRGRHTVFNFTPVLKNKKLLDGENVIEKPRIERYENQFLNLIKFEEYQFRPAGIKMD